MEALEKILEAKWSYSVALLIDVPEQGLLRGQVGNVIEDEENTSDRLHVTFYDNQGKEYGSLVVEPEQVMRLYFSREYPIAH